MTYKELDSKVRQLRKLKSISAEIEELMDFLKDEIKSEMESKHTDTLKGLDWLVTWKDYQTTRLDKKRLEEDYGDLSDYKIVSNYKRFCLK